MAEKGNALTICRRGMEAPVEGGTIGKPRDGVKKNRPQALPAG
jgi:hypothetical protein